MLIYFNPFQRFLVSEFIMWNLLTFLYGIFKVETVERKIDVIKMTLPHFGVPSSHDYVINK